MPKPTVSATVETTTKIKITLTPKALAMAKARAEEHAKISKQIKDLEASKARKVKEIEEIFEKEGQSAALDAGVDIDGFKVKKVDGGTIRKVNELEIMKTFDLSPEEFEAFVEEKPKKGHVKITAPGQKDKDE